MFPTIVPHLFELSPLNAEVGYCGLPYVIFQLFHIFTSRSLPFFYLKKDRTLPILTPTTTKSTTQPPLKSVSGSRWSWATTTGFAGFSWCQVLRLWVQSQGSQAHRIQGEWGWEPRFSTQKTSSWRARTPPA